MDKLKSHLHSRLIKNWPMTLAGAVVLIFIGACLWTGKIDLEDINSLLLTLTGFIGGIWAIFREKKADREAREQKYREEYAKKTSEESVADFNRLTDKR